MIVYYSTVKKHPPPSGAESMESMESMERKDPLPMFYLGGLLNVGDFEL